MTVATIAHLAILNTVLNIAGSILAASFPRHQRTLGFGAKTRSRPTPDWGTPALWALGRLMDRAQLLGSTEADHFLFPARLGDASTLGSWATDGPCTTSGFDRSRPFPFPRLPVP